MTRGDFGVLIYFILVFGITLVWCCLRIRHEVKELNAKLAEVVKRLGALADKMEVSQGERRQPDRQR